MFHVPRAVALCLVVSASYAAAACISLIADRPIPLDGADADGGFFDTWGHAEDAAGETEAGWEHQSDDHRDGRDAGASSGVDADAEGETNWAADGLPGDEPPMDSPSIDGSPADGSLADASLADGLSADGGTDDASDAPLAPYWRDVPGFARAIASGWAIGQGLLAATNADYVVDQWHPSSNGWLQAPGGGIGTSVDLNGTAWLVNSLGAVFRWDGAQWGAFGDGTLCVSSVASGAKDSETWAVSCTGGVWRWTGTAWVQPQPDAAGTKIAMLSTPDRLCGDHLPMVTGLVGDLSIDSYVHSPGSCTAGMFRYSGGTGYDITTDLAVGEDGNVHRWDPQTLSWPVYVVAPWGSVATRIGAGVNGTFAISTAGDATFGAIKELVP